MRRAIAKGVLLSTVCLACVTPAFGQTAGASGTAASGTAGASGVDDQSSASDIIVTAQRRNESLSKTPVSVAVLSPELLARAQIVSQQDLRTATPGLSVVGSFGSNLLNYALRGQSQDAFTGTRPGVLPYINEVQVSGGGGATSFYDLQSVQVLKGPQGTLFGRSATGGAVLFTTAKPTDELSGYASLLGGNYSSFKAEAAVSGPLAGEALTARIAGVYSRGNGFQHNLYDGSRPGDYERYGFRGSLTAHLGEKLTNELVVDYYHAEGGSTVGVLSGLLPVAAPGTPPYVPAQYLYAGVATPQARATGIATLSAFTGVDTATATRAYDAYFSDRRRPQNGLAGFLADQQARGPYKVDVNGGTGYRAKNIVVTNATTFELNDHTKLKNIFGFTHLNTFQQFDTDGTPFLIGDDGPSGSDTCSCNIVRSFSDEFQLLGDTLNGRLSYVAGAYFSDERSVNHLFTEFFDILGAPFGLSAAPLRNEFIIRNRTYAGYAQGTYKLTDTGLSVTAGLRYTSERVRKVTLPDDSIRAALGTPAPPGFNYDKAKTFNKLSWTVGLQDQVTPDLLLYVVNRRAYKSGGFNGSVGRDGPARIGGDAFEAEQVTDVEVGAKFKGRIGNMPARLNIAGYYNWLKNSQRLSYTIVEGNAAAITVNVPKGRIYGLEVDGVLQTTSWLSVGASGTLVRPKFTDGNVISNGNPQVFDRVPSTPRFSGTVFADANFPLKHDLSLFLHADAYRQAKSFVSPRSANFAGTTVPAFTLIGLRVGIEDKKRGLTLTGNVKNLTNETYYVGGTPTGEVYQANLLVPGDRRTFTLEARLKF